MPLRAKKPEVKDKRLKMMVFGDYGVGKTTAAIQFPNSYILDLERGTDQYSKTINKNGSVVFQTTDAKEIKEECLQLLTTKHNFRTLIIDPMTIMYSSIQDYWSRKFGKAAEEKGKDGELADPGMRYWAKVKAEYKAIQRILFNLDMNVLCIYHQKIEYGPNFSKIGVSFDGMKGDGYFYDPAFRVEASGNDRIAIKIKERAEIGENQFPDTFPWSYQNFLKYHGKDIIEKVAVPVAMANSALVKEVEKLVDVIKIDSKIIEKWFEKANADTWHDFSQVQLEKCHDDLLARLKNIKGAK